MTYSRRFYRVASVLFALMAIPPGYYAFTLPWSQRADFDIIGFLWLVQNIPQLMAWGLTIAFAFGCVVMALRAAWEY